MSSLNTLLLKLKLFSHIRSVNMFFSQTGEDILINGLLQNKSKGFYVDVGAFDPIKFSNTYGFYIKGWHGINIDPNPESIKKFNKARPNDTNLNVGISDVPAKLNYYKFEEGVFNTFSKNVADSYNNFYTVESINVNRLDNILDKYLPKRQQIDLMNIDTEGFDLKVLKSNNWNKYRPRVIAIEFSENDNSIENFLENNGYIPKCNTILTKMFIDGKVK